MLRDDRKRIAQQFVIVMKIKIHLLRRTVFIAEKTFAIADGGLVNLGCDRSDALRIELGLDGELAEIEIVGFHLGEGRKIFREQIPGRDLLFEEFVRLQCQIIHRRKITGDVPFSVRPQGGAFFDERRRPALRAVAKQLFAGWWFCGPVFGVT